MVRKGGRDSPKKHDIVYTTGLFIIAQAKGRHRHALNYVFGNMPVSINAEVYNTWPYETSRAVENSRTQLRPTGRAEWTATQKHALGFLGKHEKHTHEYKR